MKDTEKHSRIEGNPNDIQRSKYKLLERGC